MINLAVFGTLAVLLVAAWFIVCMATRDTGNHSAGPAPRERPRLRAAAGWAALALTWAIAGVTWAHDAIRRRIARHPAPEPITGTHMDALWEMDAGHSAYEHPTGWLTAYVERGE